MSHLLRFLVLYGWPESFDLAKHPDVLVRLVEETRITPTKLTCFIPEEKKERRRTLYKKSTLLDVVSTFKSYEWIALDDPIDGDFTNVRSQLRFNSRHKEYTISKRLSEFKLNDAVGHLRLACSYITPRYGFFHSQECLVALMFPFGIATTGLARETATRIDDLGRSLRLTHEHLSGELHDVYGLNVLSPAHLDCQVEGKPLEKWIVGGDRGELLEIKDQVTAWIVPDNVRSTVRETLFREGALIATV